MTRLKALSPEEATGKTKELFNGIQSKLGMVPNMMRTMGNSAAVLEGYLNLSGALTHGLLGAKTGELLALTIAESNACNYCLSAHTFIGKNLVHIDDNALNNARHATAVATEPFHFVRVWRLVVCRRAYRAWRGLGGVRRVAPAIHRASRESFHGGELRPAKPHCGAARVRGARYSA